MANLPTFVAKGTFTSGIAALSVPVPTGMMNDDFMLLFVQTTNQSITDPTGWTRVPATGGNDSTGTAAAAGGVRLMVYYKAVAGLEGTVSVSDSGDLQNAIIMAFRGVDVTDPFDVVPTSRVDSTATASMSWQTLTTTQDNVLIVMATGLDQDIAGTAQVGAITAAGLTNIVEQHDQTVTAGQGGGIHVATATRATAGAIGTMTATGAASTTHIYLTMPLKAAEPSVRAVGQYKNDLSTVIPVGGNSGADGQSNDIYLQTEYDSGFKTTATTPKAEVDPIGTGFAGTASSTLRSMTQVDQASIGRALRGSTMVYDDVNKRLLSFGGFDGTTRYNTVWARYIDKPGQPWRLVSTTGTAPTGRNLHGMCVVKGNLTSGGAVRSYLIVWGGADPTDKNDMLALRIDTPGSEAWTTITQTSAPTARSYVTGQLVSTPVSGATDQNYIYLYGGWAAARENGLVRCTFDVDAPTAVTWTTLKATGAGGNPTQTTGAVMDYKASTGKLYLYGGYTGTTMLNTFWEYDIAGNTWTDTTPTGTAPTASECLAGGYDATNNRFWFTGGWTTNGTFTTGINQIGYISNVGGTEAYNIVRAKTDHPSNQEYPEHSFAGFCVVPDKGWLCLRQMITGDPVAGGDNERYSYIIDFNEGVTSEYPAYGESDGEYFTARDAMASVYDPDGDEWLSIGGFDDMYNDQTIANGTHSGDIWAYKRSKNTWRYANKGFKTLPQAEGRTACYDTLRNRVLVFGGLTGVEMTSNDVYELVRDANGNYKATILRPTGTRLTQRWLSACVYDAANDRMIIALGGNQAGPINDVWALNFSGSAQGAWAQLTPTGSVTAVTGMGFADKPSNKRLYIFAGGTNSAMSTVSSQLCYLDYSTTNCAWTVVATTGAVARRTPCFDIDIDGDRLVTFGGFNGTASISTMSILPLATTVWDTATVTGYTPDARRSAIGKFLDGRFYITCGRSDSDRWYKNTWRFTPDYLLPSSSAWDNMFPKNYNSTYHSYTGGTPSTGYHWQAWTTEGSIDSPKVSYG